MQLELFRETELTKDRFVLSFCEFGYHQGIGFRITDVRHGRKSRKTNKTRFSSEVYDPIRLSAIPEDVVTEFKNLLIADIHKAFETEKAKG